MCKKTNYHGTSNTQIDKCMRPLIKFLVRDGCKTITASCCGHGKYPITVVFKGYYKLKDKPTFFELFSNKPPR